MYRYFIHKGIVKKLADIAEGGGGYQRVEIMIVAKDFELMVPHLEERKQWVQIKFMTYGGK